MQRWVTNESKTNSNISLSPDSPPPRHPYPVLLLAAPGFRLWFHPPYPLEWCLCCNLRLVGEGKKLKP